LAEFLLAFLLAGLAACSHFCLLLYVLSTAASVQVAVTPLVVVHCFLPFYIIQLMAPTQPLMMVRKFSKQRIT
jgi:hypothetical protein